MSEVDFGGVINIISIDEKVLSIQVNHIQPPKETNKGNTLHNAILPRYTPQQAYCSYN